MLNPYYFSNKLLFVYILAPRHWIKNQKKKRRKKKKKKSQVRKENKKQKINTKLKSKNLHNVIFDPVITIFNILNLDYNCHNSIFISQ